MIIVERRSKGPRLVKDDFGGKPTDTALWIYQTGTPLPLRLTCDEEHLKEIITAGQAYLDGKYGKQLDEGETVNDGLIAELSAKDIAIEQLQAKIDELLKPSDNPLQSVVDNLRLELDASKVKISELDTKLKEKPKSPSSAKTGKGGKKK